MRVQLPVRSTHFSFPMSKCAIALLCCAFSIEPLFAQELDWAYAHGNLAGQRYLSVDQITPTNVNQLAKALAVDAARLNEIVRGRRGITADTALRLARYLGTTAEFWVGLQADYELRVARREKLKEIESQVTPKSKVA